MKIIVGYYVFIDVEYVCVDQIFDKFFISTLNSFVSCCSYASLRPKVQRKIVTLILGLEHSGYSWDSISMNKAAREMVILYLNYGFSLYLVSFDRPHD